MVPLTCRTVIAVAAWIVPRPKRAEWKREWHAELWHRAEAGTPSRQLFDCAWGAFRDATWFLQTERKQNGFDLFRRPLRTEAALLAFAILVCALAGGLNPPHLPYANASRVVRLEHRTAFAGALDSMFRRKFVALAYLESNTLQALAAYHVNPGQTPGLWVTANFFDVLGVTAQLGRTLNQQDSDDTAVLSEHFWRSALHGDPKVIGTTARLGTGTYRIVGVLPPRFSFGSRQTDFYSPLPASNLPAGLVGLLPPGGRAQDVQAEFRWIGGEVLPNTVAESIEAKPLLLDPRLQELQYGLFIALLGALAGAGYVAVRRRGGMKYAALAAARIAAVLLALEFLAPAVLRLMPTAHGPYSVLGLWVFLLVCFAAVCLLTIDHCGRCLACFAKLRMPAPLGLWGSQIFDVPATEYVCPSGHGTLYVAGTDSTSDHWTVLDESWQDLFAHKE